MSHRFGCVIVNYNTTLLSLEAAQSFLKDGGERVVIVDNASTEAAIDLFKEFQTHRRNEGAILERSSQPRVFNEFQISANDIVICKAEKAPKECARLTVLSSSDNRGFAAGCNIGLRFLESTTNATHFLLLNPDAVLANGSLDAFRQALTQPGAGLCGATVLEYDPPHRIQALGGAKLSPLLHSGANVGDGEEAGLCLPPADKNLIDYPHGAAIALSRSYIDTAGFLDERFFLYFEEADWALSGRPLKTVWAPEAVVYHRYGASSGSKRTAPHEASERSPLSDKHMARSRLLFAMKWRPLTAPVVGFAIIMQSILRLARGRRANSIAMIQGLLSGASGKKRSDRLFAN